MVRELNNAELAKAVRACHEMGVTSSRDRDVKMYREFQLLLVAEQVKRARAGTKGQDV